MTPKKGKVLISEPFLPDPNFSRAVVLLTEHNESGSFGFVLNQKTEWATNMVMEELHNIHQTVYNGGPVELQSFHYLHTYDHIQGAIHLYDSVYWGGNFEQVYNGLRKGMLQPQDFKFIIGYSGWGPGQLDMELQEKAWLVGDLDAKYIFDTQIADADLWKHAIRNLGGDISLLANSPLDPNLN
jgi:putative transcriptional regulator